MKNKDVFDNITTPAKSTTEHGNKRNSLASYELNPLSQPDDQDMPGAPDSPEGPQHDQEPAPLAPKQQGNPRHIMLRNASMAALRQFGQNHLPNEPQSDIHMLSIIGQIEGHMVLPPKNKSTKYEHILPQLLAIEENPKIKGLLVVLNTVGGDIEAGLAIAEMLSSMTKPLVSLVLGGGHSIGVPIAVAADYSFIARTATMTIHPIRLTGLVISVPQTYEYLDKMQDRVVKFVTTHSKITPERFRELMFQTGELVRDVGTVLVGDGAVQEGLIDEVGGLSHALKRLRLLINEKEKTVH